MLFFVLIKIIQQNTVFVSYLKFLFISKKENYYINAPKMTNTVYENKEREDKSIIEKTDILTSNRKKTRKLLFQELYSSSLNNFDKNLFRESFFDEVHTFYIDENYLEEMHKIITFHEKFFINIVKIYAPKFNVEKMSLSNVLPVYIWLAEMFFLTEEIPGKVSLNEAVEIAKVYWDDSAKKVVNWILNKVYKDFETLIKTKDNDYSNITESCFKK